MLRERIGHRYVLSEADKAKLDTGKGWYRAGGDVICSICGHKYYDHIMVKDEEWLTRLCNGDFVHL